MTLEPLLHAPLAVRIHVATVVPAALIGTWLIFFSRKGMPLHRALGYVYLSLMGVTALTTLWVHQLMPRSPAFGLSPVHLLIPLTMWAIYNAVAGARAHDIARHRYAMLALYIGGILIAGGLTFVPGRIMGAVVFGP
ncbi:MAG TPA: DUF2306 domain-containing protein [Rhizomicrobium sp.]|nr:DUF2306 domain-containing protein [Rhizomicrobium sp.]